MAKSMTGYGLATFENEKYVISAEIKSLNSKFLDTSIRLPKFLAEKELDVRNLLSEQLERGKVSVYVEFQNKEGSTSKAIIDKNLFKYYYNQFLDLATEVNAGTSDIFKLALSSPEVINNEVVKDSEALEMEWRLVFSVIKDAAKACDSFRIKEGEVLKEKILESLHKIKANSEKVALLDPARTESIKARLKQHVSEVEQYDKNRLEQEIIYYLEKLDIKEEKVRLGSHLDFFKEVINAEKAPGKKLGFISQEIGREINTIGSKANDAGIQRLVVEMKEDLEQIKEQLLNIL